MSEPVDAGQVAEPSGPSAGTLIREARDAAGLHIAALAVSLKVPVRKLEALEADRFDLLPDAVFVRALASSVCRTLKVDPAPVLARLPHTTVPKLIHDDIGINAPFRAPNDGAGPSWTASMSRPVYWVVLVLLVGALVVLFLPPRQSDDAASTVARTEVLTAPQVASPALVPPAAGPTSTGSEVTSVSSQSVAAQVASPALSASVSLPVVISPTAVVTPTPTTTKAGSASVARVAVAPALPASGPTAASTPAAAPAPALPKTGTVVFHAKGESWVEVVDAKGTVTLRKLLVNGETVGAGGNLPLMVTVGRANETEVQVRGKPFALGPVSRDNVARFEVK